MVLACFVRCEGGLQGVGGREMVSLEIARSRSKLLEKRFWSFTDFHDFQGVCGVFTRFQHFATKFNDM